MLICFWLSQELSEILLPTHNSSDFMSNIGAVSCVSTDRSSAHFYHSHLVKKTEKCKSQTFFLVQNNVKIPWRKWETRLSPWSFALRCSGFWSRYHRAASQVLKREPAWPFPRALSLSSPAVALESISPSLLHLGRLRLDDKWFWGPRSRLHTTLSSSSFLLLVLLQAQEASLTPKCIRHTEGCDPVSMLTATHHKFTPLCSSVTSSARGLFPRHWNSECRWWGWVWRLGSAPEVVTSERWDAHLCGRDVGTPQSLFAMSDGHYIYFLLL